MTLKLAQLKKKLLLNFNRLYKNKIFYFYIMSSKNGGFPPIKYCQEKLDEIKEKNTLQKERFFAPKISNANIRTILKKNICKPIIDLNETKEELDEIDAV